MALWQREFPIQARGLDIEVNGIGRIVHRGDDVAIFLQRTRIAGSHALILEGRFIVAG